MNRNEFDYITKDLPNNSVKKACYVVREYMREDLDSSAVSKEEFDEALSILLAYSYQTSNNETITEQWYCDSDCERNNGLKGFCPGEFQINSSSKNLCKHFVDPWNK